MSEKELDFTKHQDIAMAILVMYKELLKVGNESDLHLWCFGRLEHGPHYGNTHLTIKSCGETCGIKEQCDKLRHLMWNGMEK